MSDKKKKNETTTETQESAPPKSAGAAAALSREDKIRLRAYKKWEDAGCPTSDGVTFWLEAESEIK